MRPTRPLAAALFLALLATPALSLSFGPEGKFTTMLSSLDWAPDCYRPALVPPRTATERDILLAGIKRYGECVNEQATSDRAYAARRIDEGRAKALEELRADIARMR